MRIKAKLLNFMELTEKLHSFPKHDLLFVRIFDESTNLIRDTRSVRKVNDEPHFRTCKKISNLPRKKPYFWDN